MSSKAARISKAHINEPTVTLSATITRRQREWIERVAKTCKRKSGLRSGAAGVVRDALDLYMAVLREFKPSRKKPIPPINEIITTVRAALAAYHARDTQHPASTSGGDSTPTPAASIRDEANPGGQQIPHAAHTTQPGPGEAGVSQGGESEA